VVGHIRIRTTNYQCHTVSVYLHIAAPLFRLSRIGIDFSRAIRLAIRPTARLFGFAHVFDVYTSYCARAAAKIKFEVCSCILEVVTKYNPEVGRSRSGRAAYKSNAWRNDSSLSYLVIQVLYTPDPAPAVPIFAIRKLVADLFLEVPSLRTFR